MTEDLGQQTRKAFRAIHAGHLENPASVARLRTLITTDFLKVDPDFFHDKRCVDLGAGSALHGTLNLFSLGARFVHALDLDEDFERTAISILEQFPQFGDRWQVDIGSVEALPYEDGAFDFALCHGVLEHVSDDRAALAQIHRVLKNGGMAFVAVPGSGGIAKRIFLELLRDEYEQNPEWAKVVDHISIEWVHEQVDYLLASLNDD